MLLNFWTHLIKRCPCKFRSFLLPLTLIGISGLLISSHISFLALNIDLCSPKNNVVFLKTHKCAGSSIQNIFLRYGDTHNLTFVLPKINNYIGHPTPFNRTMVAMPHLPSYNILAHHTRLDYHAISKLMPNDTIYITIVRDPIEVFESTYSYFELNKYNHQDLHRYLANFATKKMTDLHKRYNKKFGSNQMMFDLGADPAIFSNEALVKQYIDKIETWFHLVLVADRMDESLVLLKNLMCWSFDDVVTFKMNARDPIFKSSLNEKEKKLLKELNHADVLLYEHFSTRLERAIETFGRDRMIEEIEILRDRTRKWRELCVKGVKRREVKHKKKTKYYSNPKALILETTTNSNSTCQLLTTEELYYTDILRKKQVKRFSDTFIPGKPQKQNADEMFKKRKRSNS